MLARCTGDMAFLEKLAEAIRRAIKAEGDGGEYDLTLSDFPDFPRNHFAREQLISDLKELLIEQKWLNATLSTEITVSGGDLHINRFAPSVATS